MNTIKMRNAKHKTMEAELSHSAIKQLLETLFCAIKMCTDFPTDVIWINTMCAVSLANHLRTVADVFRP